MAEKNEQRFDVDLARDLFFEVTKVVSGFGGSSEEVTEALVSVLMKELLKRSPGGIVDPDADEAMVIAKARERYAQTRQHPWPPLTRIRVPRDFDWRDFSTGD